MRLILALALLLTVTGCAGIASQFFGKCDNSAPSWQRGTTCN